MSKIEIRGLTEDDRQAIGDAVVRSWLSAKDKKGWLQAYTIDDKDHVVNCIYNNTNAVIANDTYLICYDVNEVWYSEKKMLVENAIMRLKQNEHKFDVVLGALEFLALESDCVGIITSTALAKDDDALMRIYKGYEPISKQLYKGV